MIKGDVPAALLGSARTGERGIRNQFG